jgi:GcrA cell cycle regulator
MQWSDERVETLKQLAQAGNTASAIGKAMGVTKNSIIGKLNRLGLDAHAYPRKGRSNEGRLCKDSPEQVAAWGRAAAQKRWANTPRRESSPRIRPKVERRAPPQTIRPKLPIGITTLIVSNAVSGPLSKALLIDALTLRTCRWMDGHPKQGGTYCGHKTLKGQAWCGYHFGIVYSQAVRAA